MNKQDEIKVLRNKEKREFYKKYKLKIIEDHFKKKIFLQFQNSCFNCGYSEDLILDRYCNWNLVIDHHIPVIKDGHFVLGNLVVLCRSCNGEKHNKMPQDFYSESKLNEIEKILEFQNNSKDFEFEFNWDKWKKGRKKYLVSIGIEEDLVVNSLKNKNHRYYIEPQVNIGLILTVDNIRKMK